MPDNGPPRAASASAISGDLGAVTALGHGPPGGTVVTRTLAPPATRAIDLAIGECCRCGLFRHTDG
jgi:hypothetical protein